MATLKLRRNRLETGKFPFQMPSTHHHNGLTAPSFENDAVRISTIDHGEGPPPHEGQTFGRLEDSQAGGDLRIGKTDARIRRRALSAH